MGLIHLRARVCGSLLMRTRFGVCGAIVSFELAEKSQRAGLHDLWIVARCRRGVCQLVQVLNNGIRVVEVAV